MAHVDSLDRVKELGLGDSYEELKRFGYATFGRLAFASTFAPGVSDGALLENDLVIKVLGASSHPDACVLRRLFYEAHTLVAMDLRRTVDSRDDDQPRKLPTSEREARRKTLQAKIPGVTLEGELDPSNRLQDLAHDMFDQNVLRHIDWRTAPKETRRSTT